MAMLNNQRVYIYIYMYYVYTHTYIYMLTPTETYRFQFFIVFYSDFSWFLPSKTANIFFIHLKTLDAWSRWVMMLHV